ncbi:MAG: Fe-S cluster assembly protein SufD [Planctomycetota bacterium]
MPAKMESAESFLGAYADFERAANAQPAWAKQLRQAAREHALALGIPTTRHEEWRYTNVSSLAKRAHALAPAAKADAAHIAGHTWPALNGIVLTVLDGRFAPALSSTGALPSGVTACGLAEAIAKEHPAVQRHLGRLARTSEAPFVALNTAFLSDGVFLQVPKGVAVEAPIHLLFVNTGGSDTVRHTRSLLVFEAGSRATVLEHYTGTGEAPCLTNAVTEAFVGPGAAVDHTKLQQESAAAWHIASAEALLSEKCDYAAHSISLGGRLTRNDVNAKLDAEHIECTVNGFYVTEGDQHIDNHTLVDHAKPNGHSYEVYKGVLDERSVAVFNGKIFVREGAQKTDAKQDNKHLLLSRDAEVQTKPQLEIFADDVKCTHGAVVGQLDPNAVFYLRTRGIGQSSARRMLTFAFAEEVLGEIEHAGVRERVAELVRARMAQAPSLRAS